MSRTSRKKNLFCSASEPIKPQPHIYQACGYIRLSVEDSGKLDADTLESQQELVRRYIEAQPDMRFCGLYSDNGWTGTTFDRPAFERLMETVRGGKIDCIVVKDLSRFGRNYRETGHYLEHIFPYLNIRFVAINDQFDTLTAERSSDGFIVPLKNIMNEFYSRDVSKKVSPVLAAKQKNGDFIGTWAACGYQKCADDPHKIEINKETAPIVRDIFVWRVSGMSYLQIARKLNELNIPSPSRYHYLRGDTTSERYANTVWNVATVKKILNRVC